MEEQAEVKKPARGKIVFLVLSGIVLVVLISMLVGIFSDGSNSSTTSLNSSTPMAGSTTSAATTAAPVSTTAPAAATTAAPRATTAAAAGTTAPAATMPAASIAQGGSVNTYNVLTAQNDPNRMIIRNATIALVSLDVAKTLNDVRGLAIAQQGIVFSSNTSLKGELLYGTIVLQVPVQSFDDTMAQIRSIGYRVQNETSSAQDVTEEFADAESQVRNLRVTEQQYLKLMEKATNVNDIITVQNQLTEVRNKIERLQGRMNLLQKKSDFSTITVNIEPYIAPVSPTPTPSPTPIPTATAVPEWNAGEVSQKAWSGSMKGLQGLTSVLIMAGAYAIWVLPFMGVLFIIGWFWWRKTFPRKPKPPTYPTDKI